MADAPESPTDLPGTLRRLKEDLERAVALHPGDEMRGFLGVQAGTKPLPTHNDDPGNGKQPWDGLFALRDARWSF